MLLLRRQLLLLLLPLLILLLLLRRQQQLLLLLLLLLLSTTIPFTSMLHVQAETLHTRDLTTKLMVLPVASWSAMACFTAACKAFLIPCS